MTVERGADWGRPGALAPGGVVVRSDAQAAQLLEVARRANSQPPPVGLLGGDLARTLGARGDEARLFGDEAMTFEIDVGRALIDGRIHYFVAHLVARRSRWFGRVTAVMNAEWIGQFDVALRAHPGDGHMDLVDADLPIVERAKAWRRLRTGTHVPHPSIVERRVRNEQLEFGDATRLWLDGVAMGPARQVSVKVEPEALTVVV